MATTSYSTLFGTTGAGKQGSRAGIGTLFGQQAAPEDETEQQKQQRLQPTQTFAQLQKQGIARPAPQAPQGQPFARFEGSQQAQQARTGMLGALQQQLQQPTRFDTQAFQQIRGAQAAQLGAEYQAEQQRLNEELARRGLSASSIGGGRMGDLAGQQARALASLDAQLLQQAAQTQAQDRLAAMQAASQFAELAGAQDLAQFEANRVAQAAEFQQGLQGAQFGQQQREFESGQALAAAQAQQAGQESAMERGLREALGLGEIIRGERQQELQAAELTGRLGETETLAAQQQAEQRRQFDIQQELQQQLGLGGLEVQRGELGLRREQLTQQAADTAAERALRETLQTRELTAAERQQLADIEARKTLQTAQFGQEAEQARLERDLRTKLQEGQITAQERQQLADIDARKALQTQQLAQQRELAVAEITGTIGVPDKDGNIQQVSTLAAQRLGQEGLQLKLQQAAQLSQQTGNVYEVDASGNVVPKTVPDKNGKPVPVPTESALARISQERLAQAELTGELTVNGVKVQTIAARQLTQQELDALRDQAIRQSQVTGVMYKVSMSDDGKPFIEQEFTKDAQGRNVPVTTESRRAQQEQEQNQRTQIATQQAESLSQQTGLAYRVNPTTGAVEAVTDPVNPQRQLTTVEAQRLAAQTEQANLDRALRETLGMGELTGMVDGQETVSARTARNNLLVQLASAMAGSEKGIPAGFLQQLYAALGIYNPPGGEDNQDTTRDRATEEKRGATSGTTSTGTGVDTGTGAGKGTGTK